MYFVILNIWQCVSNCEYEWLKTKDVEYIFSSRRYELLRKPGTHAGIWRERLQILLESAPPTQLCPNRRRSNNHNAQISKCSHVKKRLKSSFGCTSLIHMNVWQWHFEKPTRKTLHSQDQLTDGKISL